MRISEISRWGTRQQMLQEYNRTIREFRNTGKVRRKSREDFSHFVFPHDLADQTFKAHDQAVRAVGAWRREEEQRQERERRRAEAEARMQARAAELAKRQAKGDIGQSDERESPETAEEPELPSPFAQNLEEARQRLVALKARAEDPVAAPPPSPVPPPLPAPALRRGIAFDPALPSRVNAYDSRVPQLDLAAVPERMPASDAETERLLNTIIGECHFLMQQVAFPSMCQAGVLEDRRLWANTAMDFARTGAKVAKEVARLRHGSSLKETRHTTTVIQHRVAAEMGGGGCASS